MVPPELLGRPLHPYPVYELLFDFAVLGLLWKLRGVYKADGMLFLTYVGVYAVGRFLLTFFRTEQVWFLGLQEAQVVSLALLILTVPLLSWRTPEARREDAGHESIRFRRINRMQMLKMCLNWKVMAGLAVLGGGIYAVAPSLAVSALPFLLLAICPLSMMFMMKGTQGDGTKAPETDARLTRDEQLARLRTKQADLTEQIGALEQNEMPSRTSGDTR